MRNSMPRSVVHNNVQVSNSIAQILTTSAESYAPSVVIPGSIAQSLGSIYAIYHGDSSIAEKCLHLLQAMIALGRLGLAISLLFDKEDCDPASKDNRCIVSFLFQLIYSGIVSVGLAGSALARYSAEKTPGEEQENLIQPGV